jgi:hypothetical protein
MESIENTIKKELLGEELESLFSKNEEAVLPVVEEPVIVEEQSNELGNLVAIITTYTEKLDMVHEAIMRSETKIIQLENTINDHEQRIIELFDRNEKQNAKTVEAVKEVSQNILAPKKVERDSDGKIKYITIQK